jgi:hypothetical protein|tara:strand:- start:1322 stop:1429 length:108 start_codon:yes stop_codon:yes gene_type:complete
MKLTLTAAFLTLYNVRIDHAATVDAGTVPADLMRR